MEREAREEQNDTIKFSENPAIRRLARRGVKRISCLIYEESLGVLKIFLKNVIRDAVIYNERVKRKTECYGCMWFALSRGREGLYGFVG